MSQVEKKYNEALDAMSPMQRVQRTAALYDSIHAMLSHRIRQESPGLSPRELKVRVAQQMYLSDGATQELLKRAR